MNSIRHHSASSLNLFARSPWLYSLKYIAKYKAPPGPKPVRGNAIEHGLTALMHGSSMFEALTAARAEYDAVIDGFLDEDQRELIEPMLKRAWKLYEGRKPLAVQLKIEHRMDGVNLPFDGYIDYIFNDVLDDLKTTEKIPRRGPRWDNVRQVALYSVHQEKPARVVYVSAKDDLIYEVGSADIKKAYAELRDIAISAEHFVSRIDSAVDALKMFAPDRNACYTDAEYQHAYEAHQILKRS